MFIAGPLSAQPTLVLSEGFDNFNTGVRPSGWSFTGIGSSDVYTTATNFGLASPSLRFNATNDKVTSASFPSDSTSLLTFWLRGIDTAATSSLKVEEFYSSVWRNLATIQPLPTYGTIAGPFPLNSNTTQVRFTYNRHAGEVALDDVRVRRDAASGQAYMRVYYLAWNEFGTRGQYGQSIFAELPGSDGKLDTADDVYVLYDGGSSNNAGVTSFLNGRVREKTIHHMVLSHHHTDHWEGLETVLNSFTVLNYYQSENITSQAFADKVRSRGIPVHEFKAGDYLSGPQTNVGPGWDSRTEPPRVEARVLAALATNDDNTSSAIIQVRLGDSAFLWGGDATWEAEDYARSNYGADLARTDIYQPHHHGSGAGGSSPNHSTTEFLAAMQSKYAIVPVAYGSTSSHPGAPALDRIHRAGAITYRNDLDYHVEVRCDDLGNYEITRWNVWNGSHTSSADLVFPPPPLVTGLTVRAETADYVVLGWNATAAGDRYLVYRSRESGGDSGAGRALQPGVGVPTGIYERLTPSPVSSTTYTDISAVPETPYFYRVASVRSYTDGFYTTTQERRWSNEVEARRPPEVWCLPAGGTKINGLNFETFVLIANPGSEDAQVEVEFVDDKGKINSHQKTVKARSRDTVKMNDYVANDKEAVSTIVTSDGVPIICERSMYWPGGSGPAGWRGGHNTVGIGQAKKQWYLAEGSTQQGFDQFIHVLNPDESLTAKVEIVFSDQNGVIKTVPKQMPRRTNWTVNVKDEVGARPQVATYVESKNNVPIAVDRTMYWDAGGVKWVDGHASLGTPAAAETWYLAEGATHIFDEYVMVYNPSTTATARVRLSFMDAAGTVIPHEVNISPRARYTANVNVLAGIQPQVATVVQALENAGGVRVPVVAERAMYWPKGAGLGGWTAGHGTVGASKEAYIWHLPEGATHIFDEYVLVYNPFVSMSANVTLNFMDTDGNVTPYQIVVGPRSRYTVNVNNVLGPWNQVSTMVQSNIPVVVERAMYWPSGAGAGNWVSGHNTVGVPR